MTTDESQNRDTDKVTEVEAELQAAREKVEALQAKLVAEKGDEIVATEETTVIVDDAEAEATVAGGDTPQTSTPAPERELNSTAPAQPANGVPERADAYGANPSAAYVPPMPVVGASTPQTPPIGQVASSSPNDHPGAAPQQPQYGYQQPYYQQPSSQSVVGTKDHVAAGLLAIFLGGLGIHKFYLGYNTSGIIMLAVTVIGGILTFSLASWVIWIIAIVEGILYLTKSQSEFEQAYVLNKREWF